MTIAERLQKLHLSNRTVFRLQDLRFMWGGLTTTCKINAYRMTQKKLLNRVSPGYYALSENYNIYELANLVMTPSYITGNTALFLSGINFQYRTVIESASLLNYKKKIKGNEYLFRSMKKELLFNIQGILHNKLPAIACPERAILDLLYWNLLPDIDRPEKINLSLLTELSNFYPKTVQIKAKKIHG